jgi:hypothetical protein
MIEFIGKNTDFKVICDCQNQYYSVYKKNILISKEYNFSKVKSYLN